MLATHYTNNPNADPLLQQYSYDYSHGNNNTSVNPREPTSYAAAADEAEAEEDSDDSDDSEEMQPQGQARSDDNELGISSRLAKTKKGSQKYQLWGAVFNYVCITLGAGILSLPGGLQQTGWIGLVALVALSVLCSYTAQLLVECQLFGVPGKKLKTYEDIGEAALGKLGRRIVALFQLLTLYGVCAIFFILIGGNVATLMSAIYVKYGGNIAITQITPHSWALIFCVILIPVAWLRTMKEIKALAIFGVLASLYVAFVVIGEGGKTISQRAGDIPYNTLASGTFFSGINIFFFSLGSHSVIPGIVNHMEKPRQRYISFTRWAYFIISFIYCLTAAVGYGAFGRFTEGNILNNLDLTNDFVMLAYFFITLHVVLAFPLPMNPVSLFFEDLLGISRLPHYSFQETLYRCISRTVLVLIAAFIASVVPYFGDFLSFVSSLSIVANAIILPALFYVMIFRHRMSLPYLFFLFLVVELGVFFTIVGQYYAIKALHIDFQNGGNPFSNYFWTPLYY